MNATSHDILIIGAGIAGASLAAMLGSNARVIMLEAENQPGYHSTSRSAAFFAAAYGNEVVRQITAASESFFRHPPDNFTDVELLHPRDALFVARQDQVKSLSDMLRHNKKLRKLSRTGLAKEVPILDTNIVVSGLVDDSGGDLDVDAILQGFLRQFRSNGGELVTTARVEHLHYIDDVWVVRTQDTGSGSKEYRSAIVVNAAGAWADEIAELAGMAALGIQPLRRTAVLVDAPEHSNAAGWPMLIDVDEQFYLKPDAGQLLLSPADETPTNPCDTQPDELDIAVAIDRVQRITDLKVKKINHSWAGLRTFAPDRTFVVGFDPRSTGFFWLAGQGGYGVQSSPGVADIAAFLLTGHHQLMSRAKIESLIPSVAPHRLISNQS